VATVIPTLRRTEVEVHHVDLDLGYPIFHWPPDFVDALLDQVTADFAGRDSTPRVTLISHEDRRWTLAGGGQQVIGPAPALLGWLLGRTKGTGLTSEQPLPTLEAWR
jgi:maleylpyruvate isomerase